MGRILVFIIILLLLMPVSVFADTINTNFVSVNIDENIYYENQPFLINGVTYVQFDDYINRMSENKKVEFEINLNTDRNYIVANDRYLYSGAEFKNIDNQTYVPIRLMTKIFNSDIKWDGSEKTVYVTSGTGLIDSGETFYNYDDLYWLSRIIFAESRGESFEGKLAVGTVVMNRVASDNFPNDIYSVIFDKEYGVQFTPTANKTIYNTPDEDCIIAAKICLDGYRTDNDILYFLEESIATNKWIVKNRSFSRTIGNHNFYS